MYSSAQRFSDSVLNSMGSSHLKKEIKPPGSMFIPYVRISNKYGIISTSELPSKQNPLSSFMRTRQVRILQQTAHCIYSILCACGSSYVSETCRPLAVQVHEHRHILRHSPLEKSKLAQLAFERGYRAGWDEARILESEKSNSRCRKYKESTYMACLTNSISQPTFGISPIRILCMSKEVGDL
jgi:hypothetical protein